MSNYLIDVGCKVKSLYSNDLAVMVLHDSEFDVAVYFSKVRAVMSHEEVLRILIEHGLRTVLIVEHDNPLIIFAVALGVVDILVYPVKPETVLHRLKNPATPLETAELLQKCMTLKNSGASMEEHTRQKTKFSFMPFANKAGNKTNNNPQELDKNNYDNLTGCLMRSRIDDCLAGQKDVYTVLFCDLDNFKLINDTYGHAAGDEILRLFGKHLLEFTRQSDYVFRYGGDEFIIVLTNTEIKGAHAFIERMCAIWNRKKFSCIGNRNVSFSGGLAQIEMHGKTPADVIKAADEALYRVKRSGRGRVEQASVNNRKAVKAKIPDASLVILLGDQTEAVSSVINKNKKPTVIIEANAECRLAYMVGIDLDGAWRHDWRMGLNATPYRINKKVCFYGMDKDFSDIEDRDLRALRDLVVENLKTRRVIINAGNNQQVLEALEDMGAMVVGRDNIDLC
ncbi:MAG: GGDEF domain-containing protein [Bacillota bacterium]